MLWPRSYHQPLYLPAAPFSLSLMIPQSPVHFQCSCLKRNQLYVFIINIVSIYILHMLYHFRHFHNLNKKKDNSGGITKFGLWYISFSFINKKLLCMEALIVQQSKKYLLCSLNILSFTLNYHYSYQNDKFVKKMSMKYSKCALYLSVPFASLNYI